MMQAFLAIHLLNDLVIGPRGCKTLAGRLRFYSTKGWFDPLGAYL